jgi:hypothetical protein
VIRGSGASVFGAPFSGFKAPVCFLERGFTKRRQCSLVVLEKYLPTCRGVEWSSWSLPRLTRCDERQRVSVFWGSGNAILAVQNYIIAWEGVDWSSTLPQCHIKNDATGQIIIPAVITCHERAPLCLPAVFQP